MTAKLILSLEGADSGVGKFLFFKFLFNPKRLGLLEGVLFGEMKFVIRI